MVEDPYPMTEGGEILGWVPRESQGEKQEGNPKI